MEHPVNSDVVISEFFLTMEKCEVACFYFVAASTTSKTVRWPMGPKDALLPFTKVVLGTFIFPKSNSFTSQGINFQVTSLQFTHLLSKTHFFREIDYKQRTSCLVISVFLHGRLMKLKTMIEFTTFDEFCIQLSKIKQQHGY